VARPVLTLDSACILLEDIILWWSELVACANWPAAVIIICIGASPGAFTEKLVRMALQNSATVASPSTAVVLLAAAFRIGSTCAVLVVAENVFCIDAMFVALNCAAVKHGAFPFFDKTCIQVMVN
jgi:hypothetical protein